VGPAEIDQPSAYPGANAYELLVVSRVGRACRALPRNNLPGVGVPLRMAAIRGTGATRTLGVAVVSVAFATSARAEPAKRTYPQAMADGARQMTTNDIHSAVISFRAALEARPNDPRALTELSWATFLAGEFDAAAQAANLATSYTNDPRLQAMAYYNLGRAEEARGATAEAEFAYAASLNLRDHPEVRARLKRLGPALLAPHRLAGPFAKPEDFCKGPCDVDRDVGPHWGGAAGLVAPFRDAVKIDIDEADNYPLANIAVQLEDGWYVLPAVGRAPQGHGGEHTAKLRMVGRWLVVDWGAKVGRWGHSDVSSLFVCSLTGQQPSCVGPLVYKQAEEDNYCGQNTDCTIRDVYSVRFNCRLDVRGDVVELSRDPSEIETTDSIDTKLPRPDICDLLPIAGKHTLKF